MQSDIVGIESSSQSTDHVLCISTRQRKKLTNATPVAMITGNNTIKYVQSLVMSSDIDGSTLVVEIVSFRSGVLGVKLIP
ncbi:MAG: hypothetical protein L3J59_09520 [Methylococcaceae bacterium]|nr:hypothetical protein [Methylococcaceae bacterium]